MVHTRPYPTTDELTNPTNWWRRLVRYSFIRLLHVITCSNCSSHDKTALKLNQANGAIFFLYTCISMMNNRFLQTCMPHRHYPSPKRSRNKHIPLDNAVSTAKICWTICSVSPFPISPKLWSKFRFRLQLIHRHPQQRCHLFEHEILYLIFAFLRAGTLLMEQQLS